MPSAGILTALEKICLSEGLASAMVSAMRKHILPFLILTILYATPALATIFDAADILPPNSGAISALGEILLTDPTSEGIEAHGRYGISDDWNVGAIIGTGTKDKNFRFGGQGVFSLLPDWEGQLGVSIIGTALYLRRYDGGGLQTQVGPMIHKRLTGWSGLPANLHAGLIWQVEARSGQFSSGSQLVFGSDFDVADHGRYYMSAELGIRLARTDSYVLLGIGTRLGDLAFNPKKETRDSALPKNTKRGSGERNYTDEDFKKN